MPVRKRRSKRRVDPIAEAESWACLFATGHDFFQDLGALGFDQENVMDRERAARAAAPEAWRRLGRLFLERGMGEGMAGPIWALEEFGEPS